MGGAEPEVGPHPESWGTVADFGEGVFPGAVHSSVDEAVQLLGQAGTVRWFWVVCCCSTMRWRHRGRVLRKQRFRCWCARSLDPRPWCRAGPAAASAVVYRGGCPRQGQRGLSVAFVNRPTKIDPWPGRIRLLYDEAAISITSCSVWPECWHTSGAVLSRRFSTTVLRNALGMARRNGSAAE